MNKKIYVLLFLIIQVFYVFSQQNTKTDSIKYLQDSLAFELAQMYGLDQGIRVSEGFPNKMKLIQNVDTFNFERMMKFVRENGIPSKKLVGEENFKRECVQSAFFAIMLHNPHRLVNEKEYFNIILNEVKKGNLKKEYFATILDKYYWAKTHRKDVMYGSQFGSPCLNHKEKTNKLRKEIGLPALKESEFKKCEKIYLEPWFRKPI